MAVRSKRRIYADKAELIRSHIVSGARVLDVGFSGQGVTEESERWPHALIKKQGADVYGIDLSIDRAKFPDANHYKEASAENFSFNDVTFNQIFAGDVIEHLPNPGLFLAASARHMNAESRLILTTPNAFNLFNLFEKISKDEPTVNADHTCYFNHKTLAKLLEKCNFSVEEIGYVYSLGYDYQESWKKKLLNVLYKLLSLAAPKFVETLVIVARRSSAT